MPSPTKPIVSGRVGLVVAEMQGVHLGHTALVSTMMVNCDVAYVALGSCDKHGVYGHPLTFDQRRAMLKGLFPHLEVIPLSDIDSSVDYDTWMRYVLRRIDMEGLPAPTDYYTGSEIDSRWYQHYFASTRSAGIKSGPVTTFSDDHGDAGTRRLHIVDRALLDLPSGRDIRFLIEMRDPQWKQYVPARLWDFIEHNYPPRLRQPVRGIPMPLDDGGYPVGTRLLDDNRGIVLELKDDGAWRPLRDEPDEKMEAALRMHAASKA